MAILDERGAVMIECIDCDKITVSDSGRLDLNKVANLSIRRTVCYRSPRRPSTARGTEARLQWKGITLYLPLIQSTEYMSFSEPFKKLGIS